MGISLKTHKMLWGRAANRCVFPDCKRELVMDGTETDDASLIGEECHIIARSPEGPRGNISFPKDKIDKYDNLILMCRIHHKIIDDQPRAYPLELLKNYKKQHEQWVIESLKEFDVDKQRDEEVYADYSEKWIELARLNTWKTWSSFVLGGGDPRIRVDVDESFRSLWDWLLSRIWPKRYGSLEAAFENFRCVLQDFQNVFHEYSKKANDIYYTEKFYKIGEWNEEKYKRLLKIYEFHVDLVMDLMMELTRAANYVCDKIREYIDHTFRLKEGVILVGSGPYLVKSGPHMGMSYRTHRLEYRGDERKDIPYPGLELFKKIRSERDYTVGTGIGPDDPEFLKWSRERG